MAIQHWVTSVAMAATHRFHRPGLARICDPTPGDDRENRSQAVLWRGGVDDRRGRRLNRTRLGRCSLVQFGKSEDEAFKATIAPFASTVNATA